MHAVTMTERGAAPWNKGKLLGRRSPGTLVATAEPDGRRPAKSNRLSSPPRLLNISHS